VTPETFAVLATAVSDDPKIHAKLLVSILRDVCGELPGWKLVSLNAGEERPQSIETRLQQLPPSIESAFRLIIDECRNDPDWCQVVLKVAKWMRKMKTQPIHGSGSSV
jgi:hypothetical protein